MGDSADPSDRSAPPPAPEMPRRTRLYPFQRVGLPLLALIPVLALLEVFGEARRQTHAATSTFAVEVDHPTRLRTGQESSIEVVVRNLSPDTLDTVRVIFDQPFLHRFSNLSMMPSPDSRGAVEVPGIEPAGVRRLLVELEAARVGRGDGILSVATGAGDSVAIWIETFVLP
jgi:hypothetical protein